MKNWESHSRSAFDSEKHKVNVAEAAMLRVLQRLFSSGQKLSRIKTKRLH